MTNHRSNIGPMSTRRRIATIVAVIGVLFVGSRLASLWPRTVEVSYEVDPAVSALDVDYVQEEQAVASARFRQRPDSSGFFRHSVRLQPGEYQVHITLYWQDRDTSELGRSFAAPGSGVVRFDLRSGGGRGERAR